MEPSEVLAAYGAAWERGEPEAAWAFYADDVVMRIPGRGALAGFHEGKAAVVAAIQALLARTDDATVDLTVIDRMSSPERVAMMVSERVRRGTEELEFRRVAVYRVLDDRIVDIDIFDADQYGVDEFFG